MVFTFKAFSYYFYSMKKLLFLILIIPCGLLAQENSESYTEIVNSKTLSDLQIEHKLDSLINLHIQKNDSLLINDTYAYAKRLYINGNTDKAISISIIGIDGVNKNSNYDEALYIRTLNNLSFFYTKKHDYENVISVNKRIVKAPATIKENIHAHNLIGQYSRRIGDFYNSIVHYAIAISEAKKHNLHNLIVTLTSDASISYKEIATEDSFNKGINLLTDVVEKIERREISIDSLTNENRFRLYNQLGNLYAEKPDFDFEKCILNYNKALSIAKEADNASFLGTMNNNIGYLYAKQGKSEALSYLDQSLKLPTSVQIKSITYSNKSLYFSNKGNKEKALENVQKAINVLAEVDTTSYIKNPTKKTLLESSHKYELLPTLIDKAEIFLKFYTKDTDDLMHAYEVLKLADLLADNIRLESNEERSKLFWRTNASLIYTYATKICFLLNKKEDAFYFIEKNKAILLLEGINRQQLRANAKLPDSIIKRQSMLQSKIVELSQAAEDNSDDSAQERLTYAKIDYSNFIDSLKTDYKAYYISQKPADVISINDVKASSEKRNTTYISYIIGQKNGYGLLIDEGNILLYEIKDTEHLLELSRTYRSLLEKPLQTASEITEYNTVSNAIYNLLFPEEISKVIHGKTLIISPDSFLQNIPFETLKAEPDGNYFIENNVISYAYSITLLHQNNKYIRDNDHNFIGFAPVEFNNDLVTLSETANEISEASKLFNADAFTYNNATKTNFISNSSNYEILHIASHANATDNSNPWIAFSDGNMSLQELYLTENSANLVVLSACETSLGELIEGEGVMSMARGFFNTGSKSVLSTLWSVNDKSSTEIISEFYKQLKEGATKSEAIRNAKLHYIKSHELSEQSPYYWASYTLIGDSGDITIKDNTLILYSLIGLALLIIGFFAYRKIKN